MEQNKEQNNEQGKGKNKELSAYEANINKICAILKSDNITPPTKVAEDSVQSIVSKLFEEEKATLETNVKEELKSLLKKNVLVKKEIEAKKKELQQLEIAKKKEFNIAANKLFSQFDNFGKIEDDYALALSEAAESAQDNLSS